MAHSLRQLTRAALSNLSEALGTGRLSLPCTRISLSPFVREEQQEEVRHELNAMSQKGMTAEHVSLLLSLLAEERAASQQASDRVQVVWSPPELDRMNARDTAVVVQGMFREANEDLLIVTYALDQGNNALSLFGELAERMDATPSLRVRLVTNIQRKHGDEAPTSSITAEYTRAFQERTWPGTRLPELYYDPRALLVGGNTRSVLHAKCVVADSQKTFITSANFTVAAQLRNIELGVLIDDKRLASKMVNQFELLFLEGVLVRLL